MLWTLTLQSGETITSRAACQKRSYAQGGTPSAAGSQGSWPGQCGTLEGLCARPISHRHFMRNV